MGCFAPDPVTRDVGQETADTLRAQAEMETGRGRFSDLGPRWMMEREAQPHYAENAIALSRQTLPAMLALLEQHQPQISRLQRDALSGQRASDVADVAALSGQTREAFRSLNPAGASLLDSLNAQAQAGLDANGRMDPAILREVQQATRGAQADRGMGYGTTDVFTEAMNIGQAAEARRARQQQLAAGTIGLNQSFYGDPWMQILGRSSGVNPQSYLQQANQYNPGNIYDPWNPAAAGLHDWNANSLQSSRNAAANFNSGLLGGGMNLVGSVFGAAGKTGGFGNLFS